MKILGLSCYYHDSASAILSGGQILAASQEERFTRKKHDSAFPALSIVSNLKTCELKAADIDAIIFYEKPFLKFERLLETYLAFAPKGLRSFLKSMPLWLDEKLFQKKHLQAELLSLGFRKEVCKKIYFSDHHLSHAASAFYPSPFKEALILVADGVGEWATTSVYLGKNNTVTKMRDIQFPHSLGMLYSAFTYYAGFKVNSGEYKLMGLAPYGKPVYVDKIKKYLIDLKEDGSFRLDMSYFNYGPGLTMTSEKFHKLFQCPPRLPESPLTSFHMDLASSIQVVLEEAMIKICKSMKEEFAIENLCMAGGVALNCVANAKIKAEGIFENLWIQPAAGDAGGALGAALELHYRLTGDERVISPDDSMKGSLLGPMFTDSEIEAYLNSVKGIYKKLSEGDLLKEVAGQIAGGRAIGWFQGRMEFGPRSLGNRSILASALHPGMQKDLNLKIKFSESFRPFAPAVIEEESKDYFKIHSPSPYMLLTAEVQDSARHEGKSIIPAVTHVDFSARVQTVSDKVNPLFHKLLSEVRTATGVPITINTSFNIRGEPIVCSPEDAFRCFMGTKLDFLVMNNFILDKKSQPADLVGDYKHLFELD